MKQISPDTQMRAKNILVEKLRILYQGIFSVPANLVVSCVVAFLLRHSFPAPVLIGWLTATVMVAAGRLLLHRIFLSAIARGNTSAIWAPLFCAGSFMAGALWGGLCLGLTVWGRPGDFVLLTLVGAGMTAGALTTVVTYMPAFMAYAVAFILPLATISILNADSQIAANGWLMLLYLVVIASAAKKLSLNVGRTIELQVDNEALHLSLQQTRIERDEARTQKWSTLGQLSHELRTPLNAILGFSETMQAQIYGLLGSPRYLEYASHIHSSGKHLLALTDGILQLARGEAGRIELNESRLDISRILQECVDTLLPAAEKSHITLTLTIAHGLPALQADETMLKQLALNLIGNAVKFTPAQGEVHVAADYTDRGVVMTVRDTGIGMRPEDIPLALEPFGRLGNPFKHQSEGMGLGLPICKRLVDLHGGEFLIESEPGKGTLCSVTFPPSRVLPWQAAISTDAAAA
jgi:signal transduction histidine kinase